MQRAIGCSKSVYPLMVFYLCVGFVVFGGVNLFTISISTSIQFLSLLLCCNAQKINI